MLLLRRFVAVFALMFWQGGFLFYGTVVVLVGTEVLGSSLAQGWISRSVMAVFHPVGIACVLLQSWEWAADGGPNRPRHRRRGGLLAASIVVLLVLHQIHGRMDALMLPETREVADRAAFQPFHQWYLRLLTALWAANLVYLVLTLRAWRAEDASTSTPLAETSNVVRGRIT